MSLSQQHQAPTSILQHVASPCSSKHEKSSTTTLAPPTATPPIHDIIPKPIAAQDSLNQVNQTITPINNHQKCSSQDQQPQWCSSRSNRTQPNDCHSAILTYQQVRRLHLLMEQRVPIHGRGSFPSLQVRLRDLICRVTHKLRAKQINIRDIRLNGGAASYVLAPEKAHYNDLDLIFATDLNDESKYDVIRDAVLDCLRELHIEQHSTTQKQQNQQQQLVINKADDSKNISDGVNVMQQSMNKDKLEDYDEKLDIATSSATKPSTSNGYQISQLSDCAIKEAYVHKMVKVNDEDRWSLISLGVHQSEAYLQHQPINHDQQEHQQHFLNYPEPSSHIHVGGIDLQKNTNNTDDITMMNHNDNSNSKSSEAVNSFDTSQNNNRPSLPSPSLCSSSSTLSMSTTSISSSESLTSSHRILPQNHNNHLHFNHQNQQQRQFPNSIELKFVDRMRRKFEFSVDSFQIILDSLMDFYHFAPQTTTISTNTNFNTSKNTAKQMKLQCTKIPAQNKQESSNRLDKKTNKNNQLSGSLQSDNLHSLDKANKNQFWTTRPLIDADGDKFDELACVDGTDNFAINDNTTLKGSSHTHNPSTAPSNRSESSSSGCSSSSSVVSSSSSSLSFDDEDDVNDEDDLENLDAFSDASSSSRLTFENIDNNNQQVTMSCPVISENFYPTVVGRSEYGNFNEALSHLEKKLIATRNPEQIRGGGLLKYCNLLVKNYKPTNLYQIRKLERYMCSRFFIDFCDLNQQQAKLESYLANHFSNDPILKFDYLIILHNVVQRSTVCLMNHELRVTLNMIRDLAYKLNDNQLITPEHYNQIQINQLNLNLSMDMSASDHQTAMIFHRQQQSIEMYNNYQMIQEHQHQLLQQHHHHNNQQQQHHQEQQQHHNNKSSYRQQNQNQKASSIQGTQKRGCCRPGVNSSNNNNNIVVNSAQHSTTSSMVKNNGKQQTTVSYFEHQRPPVILNSGVYRVKMVIA